MKTLIIATALTAASLTAIPVSAGERVEINKTHIVNLPQAAAAVIVGNPDIADVSVHSDRMLFLLGRSYGETDLLVLDSYGNTILNTDVTVISSQNPNLVKVTNIGQGSESYNCTPNCLPSPQFEDDIAFKSRFAADGNGGAGGSGLLTSQENSEEGTVTSTEYTTESEEFAHVALDPSTW